MDTYQTKILTPLMKDLMLCISFWTKFKIGWFGSHLSCFSKCQKFFKMCHFLGVMNITKIFLPILIYFFNQFIIFDNQLYHFKTTKRISWWITYFYLFEKKFNRIFKITRFLEPVFLSKIAKNFQSVHTSFLCYEMWAGNSNRQLMWTKIKMELPGWFWCRKLDSTSKTYTQH